MFKPALILAVVLAGPSAAQFPAAPDPKWVEVAPPEYWDPPDAPFVQLYADPAVVNEVCGLAPPGRVILACTNPERRVILMPNPCLYQHEYYAKLACHEQAHLPRSNRPGWTHNPVR